jgi:hypothetical protein
VGGGHIAVAPKVGVHTFLIERAEALRCERRNGQAGRSREVFIELGQLSAQRNLSESRSERQSVQ